MSTDSPVLPPKPEPKIRIKIEKNLGFMGPTAERYNVWVTVGDHTSDRVSFFVDVPKNVPEQARLQEVKRIFAELTLSIATAAAALRQSQTSQEGGQA